MPKKSSVSRTSTRRDKKSTKYTRQRQHEQISEDSYVSNSDWNASNTQDSDQEATDTGIYDVENYQFLLQCYEQLYNAILQPQAKLEAQLRRQVAQNTDAIETLKKLSGEQIATLQGIKKMIDNSSQSGAPLIQQLINGLNSQTSVLDIKEAQNLVSSQLSKTAGRELKIQDLRTSISKVKSTKQTLHSLNDAFIALSLLTGITITPGQNKNDAVKFINETRLPAETASFVFSIGDVNDKKNYVGQLLIHEDGTYSISCLRKPYKSLLKDYVATYNNLDQDNLQYLIQQFINSYTK